VWSPTVLDGPSTLGDALQNGAGLSGATDIALQLAGEELAGFGQLLADINVERQHGRDRAWELARIVRVAGYLVAKNSQTMSVDSLAAATSGE